MLQTGLSAILNVDLNDDQWLQASLPVGNGGLGVRGARMLAPSAFLSSATLHPPLKFEIQLSILPARIRDQLGQSVVSVENVWAILSIHTDQRSQAHPKGLVVAVNQLSLILSRTLSDVDKASLYWRRYSGDWLRTTRSFDRSEAVRWSHQCCGSTSSWLQSLQAARRTQCACGKDVDVKNVQISALFLTTFDFDRECLPNRSTFRKSKKTWSPKLTFHSDLRRRAASRRALPYTSSFFKVHFCPPLFMNCHRWNKGNLGLLRL